jgi:two-component system sensor histidine kinase BaeS
VLHSLRNWLILSHSLPLLIIIPIMGITLIYILETRLLLPQLTRTITGNATLIAQLSQVQPDAWNNPADAQAMLRQIDPNVPSRVMFLTPDCSLLASSNRADAPRTGSILPLHCQEVTSKRNVVVNSDYFSPEFNSRAIDAMAPVVGANGQIIGIVRLTYPYAPAIEQLIEVRTFIILIFFMGIISGVLIGTILALTISHPIQQITRVVYDLARGGGRERLPEQGADEVKLLSQAVNSLVERLNILEIARRRLLSNLVHELGRPLGALRSADQAILEGADKDPTLTHELLVGMDEEMGRLQNLLQSLTHHYDQVLGALELDRQHILLEEWLSRVMLTWREAARDKDIQWVEFIPPDLPIVNADPLRLAQAVENLVSNAIKYTPAGGTITVSAGCDDSKVWIRVKDTGPGIPLEEQTKIFTPFYRGAQERRLPQGMGLGLSIARDIAIAHDGQLELQSAPGKGSIFTISIPINPGETD